MSYGRRRRPTRHTTTARYLHSGRKAVRSAIEAMTDLAYPQRHAATGTNGSEASPTGQRDLACPDACPTGRRSVAVGGGDGRKGDDADLVVKPENHGKSSDSP